MTPPESAPPLHPAGEDSEWMTMAERGSVAGLRFLHLVCRVLGRRVARLALRPIVLYYLVTHPRARRASCDYLQQIGLTVRWHTVYRHFLNFAEVALDRSFLLQGHLSHFDAISRLGLEHLRTLRDNHRGALLLGAHLGSVEAMRVLADSDDLPIHVLAYTGNARHINAITRGLNSNLAGRVVEIEPGDIGSLLKVKELIDGGHLVALLGDRVGINDKTTTVDFLGRPARWPTGAYLLAAMLKCPVYLTFGLYTSPNRYEFFCEPFIDGPLELPRGSRETLLQALAQRYVGRVEHYCRMSPLNWFNFYNVWT